MDRKNFIEIMHFENHGIKDDYKTFELFPKDSFLSEEVEEENDFNNALLALHQKTNKIIRKMINEEIDYKSFYSDLIDGNSLISTYKGDFLTVSYNKIYNYLVDNQIIKNNKKTKILRVEDENGFGMYRAMENIGKSLSMEFDFSRVTQPSPMEDQVLTSLYHNITENENELEKWYFGFENKSQIFNWLEEAEENSMYEFIIKHNPDILVVEYEVPNTHLLSSDKQSVFIKEKSQILNKYKLSDLKIKESLEIQKELSKKNKIKNIKKNKIS